MWGQRWAGYVGVQLGEAQQEVVNVVGTLDELAGPYLLGPGDRNLQIVLAVLVIGNPSH
jgi:hypothetical protein